MPKPPKIPLVAWRNGRPRFSPGARLRALGYKGEDLKHDDGTWLTIGEATDWSLARQAEIDRRRAEALAGVNRKRPKGTRPHRHAPAIYSLANLFDDWQRGPRWHGGLIEGRREERAYSPATMKDYRWKITVIERQDQDLYHADVTALDETILFGLYEDLWTERGLATARGAIATISSAISWGRRRGKVRLAYNPALQLGMATPRVQVRFGERAEIAALVAAADACGRPEIGDSVILGVWTGQRQGDRLAMVNHRTELSGRRRMLRQRKTGAIVSLLEAPELERRLAASQARRLAAGMVDAQVILDERTWTPFKADHYRHVFAEIRALAVAGLAEGETVAAAIARKPEATAGMNAAWILAPCPSLKTFQDKHLRATAVVWMALGGATVPEIVSVTGHTVASAHTILKHYLAQHPDMADAAIGKMIAWFDKAEGEAK